MPNHFLLHIGDGIHFKSSSRLCIWGISSTHSVVKGFIKRVKEGDILWFVKSKSNGQLVAVATFTTKRERVLGPILELTPSNEELGWTTTRGKWDTEVHYKDLYNLSMCKLYSEIKGAATIRRYNEKCKIDLPTEYERIVRYSNITNSM